MNRPDYEALDGQGLPYVRAAKIVGELPTPECMMAALNEASEALARKLGLTAHKTISFGAPVHLAVQPDQAASEESCGRAAAAHHGRQSVAGPLSDVQLTTEIIAEDTDMQTHTPEEFEEALSAGRRTSGGMLYTTSVLIRDMALPRPVRLIW
jgi:hypothetical protein